MAKQILATIELDNDLGRGKIYTEQEQNEDGQAVYHVYVELPDGEVEDPELPQRTSLDKTNADIEASWGRGPWDLQWEA
jgi:hypothetical protein